MKIKNLFTGAMAFAIASAAQAAPSAQDVENSFYPYKNSVPSFAGYTAGMTIDSSNVEQFKAIIDPVLFDHIKKGWFSMDTTPTTSFDLHPNYVKASAEGDVTLGERLGDINNWKAGRPFLAEPSMDDPRAGEKLAWNYKYGYNWGDAAVIQPFYWKMRKMDTGEVARTLTFNFSFMNFMGRVNQAPTPDILPNAKNYFRKIYVQVIAPFDVKNTQLLIQRNIDDRAADDSFLNLSFQRRNRRLATGQITDAFLGTNLMIEDFEGYNGRVSDMQWKFLGAQDMMVPFFNHNDLTNLDQETHVVDPNTGKEDDFRVTAMGGQGGCYPQVQWQLRKVYAVETNPITQDGALDNNHPIGKRVHYFDAQTFTIPRTNIYDRAGNLWKTFIISQAHPDHHLPANKGSGVSIDDGVTMIDVQAQQCTTAQFKGQAQFTDADRNAPKPSDFTTQNMREQAK